MKFSIFSSLLLSALASSLHAAETAGPAWLRSRTLANALNPKISAIADTTAETGPRRDDTRMRFREIELGFQGEVDPYSRYDLFISKPDGEAVEVEEGYATLSALPGGFSLRAGRLRPVFGRLNIIHEHELDQVTRPLVLPNFLGPEGMREVGGEISRVFAPFGIYTELSYAFLNGLGEAAEEEPTTTTVADTSGNNVTVVVHEEPEKEPRRLRDFAHVGKIRAYGDLSDTMNLDGGVSGATHQPRERLHRQLLAFDLTFRWKPVAEGTYRSFLWRTEYLLSRRRLPTEFDKLSGAFTESAARVDKRGGYSYAQYQFSRRWKAGLRGDYVEDAGTRGPRSVTRALSPYATFTLSEFNRFRLQLERRWLPNRGSENRAYFQWTLILGPHGAHPF